MKKFAFLAIATILSTVAIAQKSFTIKGSTVEGHNDRLAYLYDYNAEKRIDSAKVENGKFEMNVKVDKPTICRLAIEGTRTFTDVIAENFPIEVDFTVKNTSPIIAKEGLNAKYSKVVERLAQLEAKAEVLMDSLTAVYGDNSDQMGEEFSALVTPMLEELMALYEDGLHANIDNAYGVLCAWRISEQKCETLAQLDSLTAIVPLAQEFAPLKAQREKMERIAATGPGSMFKDFDAQTVDGKPTKLSDYVGKGKYVLVDFWASWCGPCMREMPNLKYIHQNFPDLVVLGVNVWDKHDKFLATITKEEMSWNCIYASQNNTATELYGIQGIPTIILFAPDGKIVDRTLRGEEMKKYIANLFKK